MSKTIKSYKGFNKDMTCRDKKYEEGRTYTEDMAKVCQSGMHACEYPLDCFNYYPPATSVYHEVEQNGKIDRATDGSKIASSSMKIGARLDIKGLVNAAIEFTKQRCTTENTDPKIATAGNHGAAIAAAHGAATAGDCGAATSRGSSAVDDNGLAVARGNNVKVKGGIGSILVIAEENFGDYAIKDWKAATVDGAAIKPDTWYMLKDGEFAECDE